MEPEKLVKIKVKGVSGMKDSFELGFGIFKKKIKFSPEGVAELPVYMVDKILKEFPGAYEMVQEEIKPVKQERAPKTKSEDEVKEFAKTM